jgi:hypothetical protein
MAERPDRPTVSKCPEHAKRPAVRSSDTGTQAAIASFGWLYRVSSTYFPLVLTDEEAETARKRLAEGCVARYCRLGLELRTDGWRPSPWKPTVESKRMLMSATT